MENLCRPAEITQKFRDHFDFEMPDTNRRRVNFYFVAWWTPEPCAKTMKYLVTRKVLARMHGADPRTAKWRYLKPDARQLMENREFRDLFLVEIEF